MAKQSKMEQMQDLMLGMMADLADPKTDDQEEIMQMVKRAHAMKAVGDTLVACAKAEIQYMSSIGQTESNLFSSETKGLSV